MSNVEKKLRAAYVKRLSEVRSQARRLRLSAKAVFDFRSTAEKLEAAGIEYDIRSQIFVWLNFEEGPKNKARFSEVVKRVAAALDEQPDITVEPNTYSAAFKDSQVCVYMWDAEDCQLVETEETVIQKVTKPHPRCLAALKELEDIV